MSTDERPRDVVDGSGVSLLPKRFGDQRLGPPVSLRLPIRLLARVKALAVADGVTLSEWIRRALAREVQFRELPASLPWALGSVTSSVGPGVVVSYSGPTAWSA